jgi:DNA-binding response OmpR family regulator
MVATRVKEFKPHIPVMMLTAHASLPDDVLEHVDVLFTKGESPQKLLAVLHAMLSRCLPIDARWLRGSHAKAA